ncbi:MAG: type II toxin-antitoxin system RelE/ParE family toxin [Verrucomicrobiota bacterium]|jgi:plasmid stabilization system protein ParE
MAQVIWTEPALSDVEGLAEFIALDNPDAAASLVKKIFARVELLAKHPELGPRVPELLPASRYRHLIEPPCRIFYRYERKTRKLYILGVMRGEKLFQKRLLQKRDKR